MQQHDLSVIIPALSGADDFARVLPQIQAALTSLSINYEIIVVGHQIDKKNNQIIEKHTAKLVFPDKDGYGAAILQGFAHATGCYVVVMETDHAHPANILGALWQARHTADIIIASRYVSGGQAIMPRIRLILSKVLNIVFSRGLDFQVSDMSSGFRLYPSHILERLNILSNDYDILQELLVKSLLEGYSIREIPFSYHSRNDKVDYQRIFTFGLTYLKTFTQLWHLRNSIASADYDTRAYYSLIPPQRYWQRQRYRHITRLIRDQEKCIDVGCGSSRIIGALPQGSIAIDILMRKLRYARRYGQILVQGSIFSLPIPDDEAPCVICSQVIEHVPRTGALEELDRILQPGGLLILGTPDYSKWQWRLIERVYKTVLPQAYADEHITLYTRKELIDKFVHELGYLLEVEHYILQGELILGLRKPK